MSIMCRSRSATGVLNATARRSAQIGDIAVGAAILGSGGGSDPYIGALMAREAIRQYGPVELYTLEELDDDDLIVPAAGMGAPTVIVEKLPAGDDLVRAFHALGKYTGQKPRATMSIESGGMNSIRPIYLAARLGIPVVDCDGMGRAFPGDSNDGAEREGHQAQARSPCPMSAATSC